MSDASHSALLTPVRPLHRVDQLVSGSSAFLFRRPARPVVTAACFPFPKLQDAMAIFVARLLRNSPPEWQTLFDAPPNAAPQHDAASQHQQCAKHPALRRDPLRGALFGQSPTFSCHVAHRPLCVFSTFDPAYLYL